MRLDRFDLNLLVALDALLDERNVTRAADRLRLGQSATSAALARLREFFEDELLTQVGRQFELTPLAQALVEPVKDTLVRARAAISTRPDFDPSTISRTFRICASDYATYVLVSRVAIALAQRATGFQLEIAHLPKHVEQVFGLGDIDLLILPEQYASRIAHPQTHLLSDDHVCMMCRERPLRRGKLSEDDYFAADHVNVRLGEAGTFSFEELFFPRAGRPRKIACTVDSYCLLPRMLCGTDRIATLHRLLAQDLALHYPVKFVGFPFEIPRLNESMIWPSFRDQDPSHKFLRQVFAECAAQIASEGRSRARASRK
ncbi:LysR family transcriptional regulator [Bradyrhizobium sp. HKCCYLRH3059]|uniref:LysR family transcriptional regulator n=1 Tax=unclassified Bradyrhizobium TaxID=2631580 RepID=UPI003EBA5509